MIIKNKTEKARFGIVGILNTAIDFGLLFLLKSLGLPILTSNIISTTTAFCFSFIANKKYTFQAHGTENIKREIILFVAVTLFGLWVLQNLVITLALPVLSGAGLHSDAALFVAKILATIVSLIWNYVMYSRVVFKKQGSHTAI